MLETKLPVVFVGEVQSFIRGEVPHPRGVSTANLMLEYVSKMIGSCMTLYSLKHVSKAFHFTRFRVVQLKDRSLVCSSSM